MAWMLPVLNFNLPPTARWYSKGPEVRLVDTACGDPYHPLMIASLRHPELRFSGKRNEEQWSPIQLAPKELEDLISDQSAAVTPWGPNALNHYSQTFYSNPDCLQWPLTSPDGFYRENLNFADALGGYVFSKYSQRQLPIRVKEFGGIESEERWKRILNTQSAPDILTLTLSQMGPSMDRGPISIVSENLLLGINTVPTLEKYDVVFGGYLIDSLWSEGDETYLKYEQQWFRTLHRVRDVLSRKADHPTVHPFTTTTALECCDLGAEWIPEPVGTDEIPHFNLVETRVPKGYGFVHGARGTAHLLKEILEKQVKPGGTLLMGDVFVLEDDPLVPAPIERSGLAPHRWIDLPLLTAYLREYGVECRYQTMNRFCAQWGAPLHIKMASNEGVLELSLPV